METSTYTARIISPSAGMVITNANPDTPLTERMIARGEVWLAVTDDPANYTEITETEAQAYEAEIEAYLKAEQEKAEAEAQANLTDEQKARIAAMRADNQTTE